MDQYKHEATAVTPLVKAEKDTAHAADYLSHVHIWIGTPL